MLRFSSSGLLAMAPGCCAVTDELPFYEWLPASDGAEVFVTQETGAPGSMPPDAPGEGDRRAAVRYTCQRECLVFPRRGSAMTGYLALTHDLSATGVSLILLHPLALTMRVLIEPRERGSPSSLRARVVRSRPEDAGWFHACEFERSLTEEELRTLRS